MIRHSLAIVMVIAVALTAFAAEETLDQLKARVADAKPQDQPKLYTQIADLEFKEVDRLFESADSQGATKLLSTLVDDCEKAAKSSVTTRKHMKKTEISLRKIADQLEQIRKTIDYESRPPVQTAIERIEQARNELLTAMFSK